MTIDEMKDYLHTHNLKICNDNIIRDHNGHPKCPNPIFQPLVEELQDNGKLDYQKDTLYGQCFLTLIEICLNNKHFRYQVPEIKEECRLEALLGLEALSKYFDRTRGSTAYSYAFRLDYTNMIHVLERHNAEKQLMEELETDYNELLCADRRGKKICNTNLTI